RWLISGITEQASPSDTSTAIVSVIDRAWKNWPTTPCSRPSGKNTTTVVRVDVVTGQCSSWTASRMAAVRSGFWSRCRTIFSVMTTASSMTRPMAIAMAPRVIRLNVCPNNHITKIVMTSVSGMDDALTAVIRPWRRKSRSTTTASAAPISMASRTAVTASRTSAAWSYTGVRRTPGGSVRLRRAHHEVLPIVHRHSPNRRDGRGLADRSRELVERHPLLRQARRIGDDLDLAHVAPEHVHASDPRHPRHDRLDLVPRDVVQCGWVAALDIVRQDREERRCHPLDLDAHARRQVG